MTKEKEESEDLGERKTGEVESQGRCHGYWYWFFPRWQTVKAFKKKNSHYIFTTLNYPQEEAC